MSSFVIDPRSLKLLHARCAERDSQALFDAGTASAGLLGERWRERLDDAEGVDHPGELDMRWFGPTLSAVTESLGWGSVAVHPLGNEAILFESHDLGEVVEHSEQRCEFTAGVLAAFLSDQAARPFDVMEVECRSAGDPCCRLLAGSPETIAMVGDLVIAGRGWREAFPHDGSD